MYLDIGCLQLKLSRLWLCIRVLLRLLVRRYRYSFTHLINTTFFSYRDCRWFDGSSCLCIRDSQAVSIYPSLDLIYWLNIPTKGNSNTTPTMKLLLTKSSFYKSAKWSVPSLLPRRSSSLVIYPRRVLERLCDVLCVRLSLGRVISWEIWVLWRILVWLIWLKRRLRRVSDGQKGRMGLTWWCRNQCIKKVFVVRSLTVINTKQYDELLSGALRKFSTIEAR